MHLPTVNVTAKLLSIINLFSMTIKILHSLICLVACLIRAVFFTSMSFSPIVVCQMLTISYLKFMVVIKCHCKVAQNISLTNKVTVNPTLLLFSALFKCSIDYLCAAIKYLISKYLMFDFWIVLQLFVRVSYVFNVNPASVNLFKSCLFDRCRKLEFSVV